VPSPLSMVLRDRCFLVINMWLPLDPPSDHDSVNGFCYL